MSEGTDEKTRIVIKGAIPPVANLELQRDLWPQMLRRLEPRPLQMPWLDWALLGLLGVWILFFPEAIPLLLYEL